MLITEKNAFNSNSFKASQSPVCQKINFTRETNNVNLSQSHFGNKPRPSNQIFDSVSSKRNNAKAKRLHNSVRIPSSNHAKMSYDHILWARIQSHFKEILLKVFLPHMCSTFLLMFIVGVRNNLIQSTCFLDNVVCMDCSRLIKLFYMFPLISLEFLIPILYAYYFVFYSNQFPHFFRLSLFSVILYYVIVFLWFCVWDAFLYQHFPEKTVDNFIYLSLFFVVLPLIKNIAKLSWCSLIQKTKYNALMVGIASSTFFIAINILNWFQQELRKGEGYQNLYQMILVVFCVSYESCLIHIMVKRHPSLMEDWQNNNCPLLFISKNILIFSYAIRLANISVLNYNDFGFYLQIGTFVQYVLEMLSGKSLVECLLRKLRNVLRSKMLRKTSHLHAFKISNNENEQNLLCLRIMSYQKIEFTLIYFPRILYMISVNKWSISLPFLKLVEGCSFNINQKIKINAINLLMMMGIDVFITMVFLRRMIKNHRLLKYIKFEAENMPFHHKVALYIAFQICFEYWFHYYMKLIYFN